MRDIKNITNETQDRNGATISHRSIHSVLILGVIILPNSLSFQLKFRLVLRKSFFMLDSNHSI